MSSLSVLGLSAYYHDASAALVVDGEVVAAAAEERFTRLKHDASFPKEAIAFCLARAGLQAQELDAVVFYEEPHIKFTRVLCSTLEGWPASRGEFVGAMKAWLGNRLWTRNEISLALDIHPAKVRLVPHHTSHAVQAFAISPFAESAILTIDAVGEWSCTVITHGTERGLEVVESIDYPHSIGLVYAAFTAFLGLRPNDAEASTMALSAFGRPRFADDVRTVLRPMSDGRYRVDHRSLNVLSPGVGLFGPEFLGRFGPPREVHRPWPFDALRDGTPVRWTEDDQRYADIAASVQLVLEETAVGLARRARRLTGSGNLCFAGGVALNAVANSRVIDEAGFDGVFIPPDPGDGGAAMGAALFEYARLAGPGRRTAITPFLGQAYETDGFTSFVRRCDPSAWSPYLVEGTRPASTLSVDRYASFGALVDRVADELCAGNIVGWFQDRFELGPRALGNRSILAAPGDLDAVARLSSLVKKRARFRPYALSVREEDAPAVFERGTPVTTADRWMQRVRRVQLGVLPGVRGAVHVDRTSRLQVCSAADNLKFHRLLDAVARRTGLGALLNTSFNEPGYPIVALPNEALLTFARTDMDLLVVQDTVVAKRRDGDAC